MSDSIYSFENQGRRKFPDQSAEDQALKEFAVRLKFSNILFIEHRDLLLNFILNHHKVISRYEELRGREMRFRVFFTGISLLLLFGVPLLIFVLGVSLSGDKSSITAQVTALLTGLIAVQKSLSSWLDKRKVIGNFWKAESNLKTTLYTFEDKWRGNATESFTKNWKNIEKLKDDFLNDSRASITTARAIVQDEQSKFFDAVTFPSIDLGEMLKDAGERAKSLVGTYYPPELDLREKQRQALEEIVNKIAEQKSKIVQLKAEIEQRNLLIGKKQQAMEVVPKDEQEALKLEITTHRTKMRQAEDELILAKSRLESLRQSKLI